MAAVREEEKMTVNELVCIFPRGTTFFIHMIYADNEKTRRLWDHNHSVGWGPDFYGITRHPVGECTVRDIQIPVLTGYKSNCDVTIYAFEPNYCEKLLELERGKHDGD